MDHDRYTDQYIAGILAECGGGATCGTCHLYIDEDCTVPLPPMLDLEDELLEVTPKAIRLRKRWLDPNERKKRERAGAAVG